MEPEKFFSDSTNQTLLQQAELDAILRMLSISEGTFSLSIAICNSPALREYLISKITEHKAGIEKIPIEKNCTDMLAFAEKKITIKRPSAIFITEIENALPSDDLQPRIIRNLNASRELWQQKFSCPVVFWMGEYAATMMQRDALDFASWLSHIFEFISEQATATAGTLDAYSGDIMSAGKLDAEQKRFRIAELEQRIDEAGDPPKAQLVQHVLIWLNELTYIYRAIGDMDRAQDNITKSLHIAEKLGLQTTIASDYGNLGLIYQTRGDLDKAEEMFHKVLDIDNKLGRLDSIANAYGNLGVIYKTRGDLDKAEQMLTKSLEINKKLRRLEGMANQYGNLGLIYQKRGDLDKAEEMFHKVIEIENNLGRLDSIANTYCNLGIVYKTRGDLDKAEQMLKKSLEIEEKLGRLGGMASDYANLGVVYKTRGDMEKAEQMHKKSLEIYEKLEQLEGMANQYGNLGVIYLTHGELDKAEQMLKKSLEISEPGGMMEVTANQYANLGSVYKQRGDIKKAREYWEKALELFKKIGMKPEIEEVQGWIEELKDK